MENDAIPVTGRERRLLRRDFILLLETLEVSLRAGLELSYAWREGVQWLAPDSQSAYFSRLSAETSGLESFSRCLKRLTHEYPDPAHRPWFAVLSDLYSGGASLSGAVAALGDTLRAEEERELEAYLRRLPARANSVLLVFFLPPALLLIFAPLVQELGKVF